MPDTATPTDLPSAMAAAEAKAKEAARLCREVAAVALAAAGVGAVTTAAALADIGHTINRVVAAGAAMACLATVCGIVAALLLVVYGTNPDVAGTAPSTETGWDQRRRQVVAQGKRRDEAKGYGEILTGSSLILILAALLILLIGKI